MSGVPFYKKAATEKRSNFEWPPKREVAPVKVSRQKLPEEVEEMKKKIFFDFHDVINRWRMEVALKMPDLSLVTRLSQSTISKPKVWHCRKLTISLNSQLSKTSSSEFSSKWLRLHCWEFWIKFRISTLLILCFSFDMIAVVVCILMGYF